MVILRTGNFVSNNRFGLNLVSIERSRRGLLIDTNFVFNRFVGIKLLHLEVGDPRNLARKGVRIPNMSNPKTSDHFDTFVQF